MQRDGRHAANKSPGPQRDGHRTKTEQLEIQAAALEDRIRAKTTELLAANVDLKKEISRRNDLETDLLSVIDRTQRRIGQELHDGLCQHLSAVAFMARAVARRLKDHRVVEVADIDQIAQLINEGVTEARSIARGLHPVEIDSDGLMAALETLARKKHWAVPVRFEKDGAIPIQDDTTALHFYRIASEAILNANKHSSAREIVAKVKVQKDEIVLSVTDDGVGVSPRARKGMGFHIMEYRARTIGGELLIERLKPRGTRVTCRLPCK